jgi:steroid delta-isomerase-like uncharacterized protein
MKPAARGAGAVALATAAVVGVRRRRSHDPERLVRRYFDAWASGDSEALDELLADDYCGHVHTLAGTEERDRDGLASLLAGHAEAFEQVEYEVQDVLKDDGRVAARVAMRADHRETGRSGEIEGLAIFRLHRGRIAEEWSSWDYLGLADQLGLAGVAS